LLEILPEVRALQEITTVKGVEINLLYNTGFYIFIYRESDIKCNIIFNRKYFNAKQLEILPKVWALQKITVVKGIAFNVLYNTGF